MPSSFNALLLTQEDKRTIATIASLTEDALPAGDVHVKVTRSSLNYKDGLAITGKGKIIRDFPMVPGIDFAGEVLRSDDTRFHSGQHVILTGWGVGERHWGGMAEQAQVKADWLVAMPEHCDADKAMAIGTAGLTAMLCVQALIDGGVTPEHGEILVSGASGGVGSVAVTLLAKLGYQVVAISGRVQENQALLLGLGAKRVLDRQEFEGDGRPLDRSLWAGMVDTVGDKILANALSQMHYNAVVAACGLAAGIDLPTTVMPFILRNVRLQGIDSVMCPTPVRQQAWQRLIELLPESFYQQAITTITLNEVPQYAEAITLGQVTGRVVVKLTD